MARWVEPSNRDATEAVLTTTSVACGPEVVASVARFTSSAVRVTFSIGRRIFRSCFCAVASD